ncbi:MAG: VWA domain-containing protein [Gemmatimonadales bacterium]|nr:MAG: VWA domain-containing protein [Gemmatimonadales bacterium]
MAFLAPLLLLAALALAVPLLVHLLRREDPRTRSFPALRYLARTVEARSRTLRIQQLLLLVLRLAAVALLVLAAARLVLPLGSGEHPPASLVIVIDNGVHSGAIIDGERVLDHLVRRGTEALQALGPLDRVWVVAGGEPGRASTPLDADRATEALQALSSTGALPELPALVERASALLDAAGPGPTQILVLSSLSSGTFPRSDPSAQGRDSPDPSREGSSTHPILLQGPGLTLPPNRGIASIRLGGGLPPRAGDESTVDVTVAGDDVSEIPVRLLLDGELVAAGRTDGTGLASLPFPARAESWVRGVVEIDPDPLRADDRREFVAAIRPPPVVSTPAEPHPFLDEALQTLEGAGRIRLLPIASPDAEVLLLPGSVLAFGAFPEPTSPGVTRVVTPPDDPALLPAFNRILEGWAVPWRLELDRPEARSTLIGAAGYPPSLEGIEVSLRYRLVPLGGASGVEILRENGSPWLVRTRITEPTGGPLILLASSLHPDQSELPLSAAMIPFLDRILTPGGRDDPGGPTTGHPAGTPFPLPEGSATVLRPDGTQYPIDGLGRLVDTGQPGLYEIRDATGEPIRPVAVQIPEAAVRGSDGLSLVDAAARLGSAVEPASSDARWTRALLPDRRGREVALPLVIAALLLLLLEGWVAARSSGGRSEAKSGELAPPRPAR